MAIISIMNAALTSHTKSGTLIKGTGDRVMAILFN
jgi:hypothetical protein